MQTASDVRDQASQPTTGMAPQLGRVRLGLRVALEELLAGRDYARVENILRDLEREISPAR